MKKYSQLFLGVVIGAILFSAAYIYAEYSIMQNPYKILVNSSEKLIEGYNIDGYSYFKLRDIGDALGNFEVDFKDDTIIINTKEGEKVNVGKPKLSDAMTKPSKTYTEQELYDTLYRTKSFDSAGSGGWFSNRGFPLNGLSLSYQEADIFMLSYGASEFGNFTVLLTDIPAKSPGSTHVDAEYFNEYVLPVLMDYAREVGMIVD